MDFFFYNEECTKLGTLHKSFYILYAYNFGGAKKWKIRSKTLIRIDEDNIFRKLRLYKWHNINIKELQEKKW